MMRKNHSLKFSIGAFAIIAGMAILSAFSAYADNEQTLPEQQYLMTIAEKLTNKHSNVENSKQELTFKDVPKLRPKEVTFATWQDLLNWKPGARPDDDINRSSVPLASRYQGSLINKTANPEAQLQALSNMNSKAATRSSVGDEEFNAYAFDYWQYVHSMVYWDGLVPTPDVIDAAHRNGVPIYGSLFFNWSTKVEDQKRLLEAMKQDSDGSFPIAKKLAEIAKYYGYDGYFINQETWAGNLPGLPTKIRDFIIYLKEYSRSIGHPLTVSWYDAMLNNGKREYINGLNDQNDFYLKAREADKKIAADTLFANFNWTKSSIDESVKHAKTIGRNPYDVYAGLELQKGGSYKTDVNWNSLLDPLTKKLKTSLGLFASDTIISFGKTGEEYHRHENRFWTGFQGDPTVEQPANQKWRGISNLIADRTPITGTTFNTYFNTGHGRKWFVDGAISKDGPWNYRSVSGILPTWRWWIQSTGQKLNADYDFEQAFNGGNSLKFTGNLTEKTKQDIMLYSTKLEVKSTSKLRVSYRGGAGTTIQVGLATSPDYKTFEYRTLTLSSDNKWKTDTLDLSSLAGKTIYGIKLTVSNEQAVSNYQFNLGQLGIFDTDTAPSAPSNVVVKNKVIKTAREAEATLTFKASQGADYYEVYQEIGNKWKLVTGSSSTNIYLSKISRLISDRGESQRLKVVAVGKNGVRSTESIINFNWGLAADDTTDPKPEAPNVVLGAVVTGTSLGKTNKNEGPENMLTGTITGLSDKWSSSASQASVDIKLTQPRTIVRWVTEHAGAGGESVNDGLMNTKDFDLYYKDEAGKWKLAKSIRGNKAHVTDITLDRPITAQEWRLHVITSDNGTPWKAIRIYNWKMYESLNKETPNIPMQHTAIRDLGNNRIQVGFKNVPANTTVNLYDSKDATKPIATHKTTKMGNVIFKPIDFKKRPRVLYYRTQADGMDLSNRLAIIIPPRAGTEKPDKPQDDNPTKPSDADKMMTLVDKDGQIKVIGTAKALNGATQVKAQIPTETPPALKGKNYQLYDITLYNAKGEKVQVMSEVTVLMRSKGKVSKVYHVSNNKLENLPFTQNKDLTETTFKTAHFSQYAAVYENTKSENPDSTSQTKPSASNHSQQTNKSKNQSPTNKTALPSTGSTDSHLSLFGVGLIVFVYLGIIRKKEY